MMESQTMRNKAVVQNMLFKSNKDKLQGAGKFLGKSQQQTNQHHISQRGVKGLQIVDADVVGLLTAADVDADDVYENSFALDEEAPVVVDVTGDHVCKVTTPFPTWRPIKTSQQDPFPPSNSCDASLRSHHQLRMPEISAKHDSDSDLSPERLAPPPAGKRRRSMIPSGSDLLPAREAPGASERYGRCTDDRNTRPRHEEVHATKNLSARVQHARKGLDNERKRTKSSAKTGSEQNRRRRSSRSPSSDLSPPRSAAIPNKHGDDLPKLSTNAKTFNKKADDGSSRDGRKSYTIDSRRDKRSRSRQNGDLRQPARRRSRDRARYPVESSRTHRALKLDAASSDRLRKAVVAEPLPSAADATSRTRFDSDRPREKAAVGLVKDVSAHHFSSRNVQVLENADALLENVPTVYRDRATGRKIDIKARDDDAAEQERKAEERKKLVEKYAVLNRGVRQIEEREKTRADMAHEMAKPLARARDDKDLDKIQRERMDIEDPMLDYIKNRKHRKSRFEDAAETRTSVISRSVFRGPWPANRYNITPGHRWDGVDRSNGFEPKLFKARANKSATAEVAYKWSTEDM